MNIKEKIAELLEDSIIKDEHDEISGCFKNIVLPSIMETNDDDETLIIIINSLLCLSEIYDSLLDNIAKFGSQELIKKCGSDIQNIFQSESNEENSSSEE